MTFEPFDVVVVPFPFTEKTATKRRPALVLSTLTFNQTHDQVVLGMITTTSSMWPSDVVLHHWQPAGLTVPCHFRVKLFTLEQALVLKAIGRLKEADQEAVKTALSHHLV